MPEPLNTFTEHGYWHVKQLLKEPFLTSLRTILIPFHENWLADNREFYAQKAINSAYLTANKYHNATSRETLFCLLASEAIGRVVIQVLPTGSAFMGTQLFFNPADAEQHNYWHRDPQYHMSLAEQQDALRGPQVVHVRIPLYDEPGIELVPGTHKRWDTNEELDVRLARNNRQHHDVLPNGLVLPLAAGDMLVFSANMLHRGLYGKQRLALDILFCEPVASLVAFLPDECLPDATILGKKAFSAPFVQSLQLKHKVV